MTQLYLHHLCIQQDEQTFHQRTDRQEKNTIVNQSRNRTNQMTETIVFPQQKMRELLKIETILCTYDIPVI